MKHDDPSPRAVCVDTCPREIGAPFKCHGTKKIDASVCENEFGATGKGHVGYGTKPLLRRFCLPDIDKLPKEIDVKAYDNLVGEFGLDDIQEIG